MLSALAVPHPSDDDDSNTQPLPPFVDNECVAENDEYDAFMANMVRTINWDVYDDHSVCDALAKDLHRDCVNSERVSCASLQFSLNDNFQLAQLLYYFVRQITWSPTVKTFDKNPFIKMVNQMRNILTAIKRKVRTRT